MTLVDQRVKSVGSVGRRFLEFCAAPHGDTSKAATRVYFGRGWHGLGQIGIDHQELRRFIRQAHDAGIEVYSNTQGYRRWATPTGQSQAVQIIDHVLRFSTKSPSGSARTMHPPSPQSAWASVSRISTGKSVWGGPNVSAIATHLS